MHALRNMFRAAWWGINGMKSCGSRPIMKGAMPAVALSRRRRSVMTYSLYIGDRYRVNSELEADICPIVDRSCWRFDG